MFHWEDGLKLTRADLAVDFSRRQPRGFISHAHADHMARHEYALCTPATAALYQHRLGKRPTLEMPFGETIEWGGLRLTTYPAGHCLGSAMLLAEDAGQTLLYTGDFKLAPSVTAEMAELPTADILVMESTFGRPTDLMPPRQEVIAQLVDLVRRILKSGATPVVIAYALGKSQEVTRLLTAEGFQVAQHRSIYEISQVYERCGCPLGSYRLCTTKPEPGEVLIMPPRAGLAEQIDNPVRIAVTGWALDPRTKYRHGVDHALPLSDHADYAELFQAVRQVSPKKVYCTHGPESFVDRLCEEGIDAYPLGRSRQGRLF